MAKDDRGAAANKLLQMIQSKKTGDKMATPATPARVPGAAPQQTNKKSSTPKVVLSKPVHEIRGNALVIDANPRIASTLQNTLKGMKFNAEVVSTGAEALALLAKTPYTLVITDLQLPDIAGFNLCSKIRILPGGREMTIIITGEDKSPGMEEQALMVDANAYMVKPINTGELGAILSGL